MEESEWVDHGLGFTNEELTQDIEEVLRPHIELLAVRRAEAEVALGIPRRIPYEYRNWDKKVARSVMFHLDRRLAIWESQESLAPVAVLEDHVIRPRGAVIVWEDWFTELLEESRSLAVYTITLGQRGSGRGRRSIRAKGWRVANDYKVLLQCYNRYVSPARAPV